MLFRSKCPCPYRRPFLLPICHRFWSEAFGIGAQQRLNPREANGLFGNLEREESREEWLSSTLFGCF